MNSPKIQISEHLMVNKSALGTDANIFKEGHVHHNTKLILQSALLVPLVQPAANLPISGSISQ